MWRSQTTEVGEGRILRFIFCEVVDVFVRLRNREDPGGILMFYSQSVSHMSTHAHTSICTWSHHNSTMGDQPQKYLRYSKRDKDDRRTRIMACLCGQRRRTCRQNDRMLAQTQVHAVVLVKYRGEDPVVRQGTTAEGQRSEIACP